MLTKKQIDQIALSFPETDQSPHFEIISYRVAKKIFSTLNMPEKRVTLKLNAEYQDLYTAIGKGKIYRVPNAWGKFGWTTFELSQIKYDLLQDAMLIAWRLTSPKKFIKQYPDWFKDDPS